MTVKNSFIYFIAPILISVWIVVDLIIIMYHTPQIDLVGESARNVFIHPPIAWVTALAYLVSAVFAVLYLIKKDIRYDIGSYSSAAIGLAFSLITVTTGMVWAKSDWGTAWNWDPKETTFLIVLIIYMVYFTLRSSVKVREKQARLSSVYVILAFTMVPLLYFIPQIGSGNGNNPASLHPKVQFADFESIFILLFSIAGFTLLFVYLLFLSVQINRMLEPED